MTEKIFMRSRPFMGHVRNYRSYIGAWTIPIFNRAIRIAGEVIFPCRFSGITLMGDRLEVDRYAGADSDITISHRIAILKISII